MLENHKESKKRAIKMLDNIIGVEEASEILKLSPGSIKNMCAAKKLPCKKIGKTWILDKSKLKNKKQTS